MSAAYTPPNLELPPDLDLRLELLEANLEVADATDDKKLSSYLRVRIAETETERARKQGNNADALQHHFDHVQAKIAHATEIGSSPAVLAALRVEFVQAKIARANGAAPANARDQSMPVAPPLQLDLPAGLASDNVETSVSEGRASKQQDQRGALTSRTPAASSSVTETTAGISHETRSTATAFTQEASPGTRAVDGATAEKTADAADEDQIHVELVERRTASPDINQGAHAASANVTTQDANGSEDEDEHETDGEVMKVGPPPKSRKLKPATQSPPKKQSTPIELTDDEDQSVVRVKTSSMRTKKTKAEQRAVKVAEYALHVDKGKDYAGQFMGWVAFAFNYSSMWGKEHQRLAMEMLTPLVAIEMRSMFTHSAIQLPGRLPYMNNWASKRRMPCKFDPATNYEDSDNKESYTLHFELKLTGIFAQIRELEFDKVLRMSGRHGFVTLVRGLMQARATERLGSDWVLFARELANVLALVRAFYQTSEYDDDEDKTVLQLLMEKDPELTRDVSEAIVRRGEELEELQSQDSGSEAASSSARTPTPAPSPSKVKVKVEKVEVEKSASASTSKNKDTSTSSSSCKRRAGEPSSGSPKKKPRSGGA